jgi:hypothetical protein
MATEAWNLFLIVIFSAIGFGYFIYGKRQREGMPLVAGILLMLYPYFVSSTLGLIVVGIMIMAVPFAIKRIGL